MASSKSMVLGYWDIRGLAHAIRIKKKKKKQGAKCSFDLQFLTWDFS